MKTAVIHDWLITYAGAERVLEQILYLYPEADVFTLFDFLPDSERQFLLGRRIYTSFLQHLPLARKRYRQYLPLMPLAIGRFDLSAYGLIISSSHAVAKGVRKSPGQLHICYCHTPMRYAWDLREQYLKESGLAGGLKGGIVKLILDRLQVWDVKTSDQVDYFIANSKYIADRIKRAYGRESTVIYPPVDVEKFTLHLHKDDYYITASRMVPYKKMDMIVQAFAGMHDKRLIVIGVGPDFDKIKALAENNIEFLGYREGNILISYLQRAKAFIFAAEEDFGIVPVEAQACGTPVIAFGKGGALETVIDGQTGVFFHDQDVESLIAAVNDFEQREPFDSEAIRRNAERFAIPRFRAEFSAMVDKAIRAFYQKKCNIK